MLREVQKAGRLADNPKRQSLVGVGLERATLPSQVSKGQSLLVAMKWRKKAVKDFLLGKLSFARAFRNGIDKGSRGYALAQ